jgi:predicted enzyme related to lactoylglutathione lyase
MPSPITHFEIAVKDLNASVKFYKKVFGWDIRKIKGMKYAMIDAGKKPGGGIMEIEGADMRPYVAIYPEVDDIDAVLKKAEKAGAFIIAWRTEIGGDWGFYGMFADPDRNVIGVWSKK